ncbi:MAG: tRNA pseudouridine(55) synthase TruB, partial [Pseudomonadota bacterium]
MTINGWLNIYKPTGITSAKLVGGVKRMLHGRITKIGHTGTLDPEAEGILPLALG